MSSVTSSTGGGTFNIDGLGSGLDSTSIINTLMQIESRPQSLMKQRKSTFDTASSAITGLNSLMTTLKTKAAGISNLADWEPVSATSSNTDYATVTGSSGGSIGSISFHVDSLATSNVKASYGAVASLDTKITDASSITIALASGGSKTLDVAGGTLNDVVNAINSQGEIGIAAAAVQVGDGQYKLQLSTVKPGESLAVDYSQFNDALKGGESDWIQITAGSKAQITVGTPGDPSKSYVIQSDTNTFAGVLPGVSVDIKKAGTDVTVTSSRDLTKMESKIQEFIDAYNAVTNNIRTQTSYDQKTKVGGPLLGSPGVRQAQTLLANAIMGDPTTTPYLAGIELDKDGTLKFDKTKFETQFKADPETTKRMFVTSDGVAGLGARVREAADSAVRLDGGLLTSAKDAAEKTATDLQERIDAYQVRLDRRALTLRQQFTALDTAMSNLKTQGTWVSSFLR